VHDLAGLGVELDQTDDADYNTVAGPSSPDRDGSD